MVCPGLCRLPVIVLLLAAPPARADVAEVLDAHILPAVKVFAEAASTLADVAAADCTRAAVLPAYQAAFDAWTPVADLRLGPSEAAALSIAFWPDERGSGLRALQQMLATADPAPTPLPRSRSPRAGFRALTCCLAIRDLPMVPLTRPAHWS